MNKENTYIMFPNDKVFVFKGCIRKVVTIFPNVSLSEPIIIDTNKIYLGKFLRTESIEWNDCKIIEDGLAIFEYGAIRFPDYGDICIYKEATLESGSLPNPSMYGLF